jgi:hypothetical protein
VTEEAVLASFPNATVQRSAGVSALELHIAAFQDSGVGNRKVGGDQAIAATGDGNKKSSLLRSLAKAEFNKHHARVCGVFFSYWLPSCLIACIFSGL